MSKSLDELAHDAEVEAEVLRAVGYMTPARAQEFLMGLVLRIRRAQAPAACGPATSVTLPKLVASIVRLPEPGEATSWPPTTSPETIVEYVKANGPCKSSDILDGLMLSGPPRNRAHAVLNKCIHRDRSLIKNEHGFICIAFREETGS